MLSLSFSICRLDGAVLRPVRATPECLHTAGTWWERGLGRLSKTLFTLCVTLGAHVHMCMLACGGSADAIHLSLGEVGSLIELAFTVSQQAFLSASDNTWLFVVWVPQVPFGPLCFQGKHLTN